MAKPTKKNAGTDAANDGTNTQEQPLGGPSAEDLGTDVGYIGQKVDPRPNEDYSLESGPESPSALEAAIESHDRQAEALRNPDASTAPSDG